MTHIGYNIKDHSYVILFFLIMVSEWVLDFILMRIIRALRGSE